MFDRAAAQSQIASIIESNGASFSFGELDFKALDTAVSDQDREEYHFISFTGEEVKLVAHRSALEAAPGQGDIIGGDSLQYRVLNNPRAHSATGEIVFICEPFEL
ncbi:MAG: hypothetical protein AAFX93_18615 [Verrucomicrobiota bacterium]